MTPRHDGASADFLRERFPLSRFIDTQTEPSSRELQEIELALAASFARGVETGHLAKAGLSECAGKAEARENSACLE